MRGHRTTPVGVCVLNRGITHIAPSNALRGRVCPCLVGMDEGVVSCQD